MQLKYFIVLFFVFTSFYPYVQADDPKKIEPTPLKEETVVTQHTIKINGVEIPYQAIVGNLLLKDDKGQVNASIYYIAYHKQNVENLSERPITYCFNGGPGSSSVWLHMGAFGPKRVVLNNTQDSIPPIQIADNDYSILDLTDLVFIDPVSTGFSRAAPGEDAKKFHGVEEDIHSVGDFIRLYTTHANRWNSPKYIAGESYGTTRAAGLSAYLHDEHLLYLNGIILISALLNYQTLSEGQGGNDLPFILSLPSFTTAAWFHKKLSDELQTDLTKAIEQSKSFALNEYTLALMKGDLLSDEEKKIITNKLAYYTGLSPDYIDRCGVRISLTHFNKELLRSQKRTIGRFDSRFTGIDSDACGVSPQYDPSEDVIFGAYTVGFNSYLRSDLNWKGNEEYIIIGKVSPWNYGKSNQFLDVAAKLRSVITRNSGLKVFVASGIYDMAIPFFGTEYTFNHLGLEPPLRKRITIHKYEGGHMMYINLSSLIQLKKDLIDWMR